VTTTSPLVIASPTTTLSPTWRACALGAWTDDDVVTSVLSRVTGVVALDDEYGVGFIADTGPAGDVQVTREPFDDDASSMTTRACVAGDDGARCEGDVETRLGDALCAIFANLNSPAVRFTIASV
jgi:hypothetical protein